MRITSPTPVNRANILPLPEHANADRAGTLAEIREQMQGETDVRSCAVLYLGISPFCLVALLLIGGLPLNQPQQIQAMYVLGPVATLLAVSPLLLWWMVFRRADQPETPRHEAWAKRCGVTYLAIESYTAFGIGFLVVLMVAPLMVLAWATPLLAVHDRTLPSERLEQVAPAPKPMAEASVLAGQQARAWKLTGRYTNDPQALNLQLLRDGQSFVTVTDLAVTANGQVWMATLPVASKSLMVTQTRQQAPRLTVAFTRAQPATVDAKK